MLCDWLAAILSFDHDILFDFDIDIERDWDLLRNILSRLTLCDRLLQPLCDCERERLCDCEAAMLPRLMLSDFDCETEWKADSDCERLTDFVMLADIERERLWLWLAAMLSLLTDLSLDTLPERLRLCDIDIERLRDPERLLLWLRL